MQSIRWIRKLRQPDQPASFYDDWLGNTKRFHEFVFVTIESNIFLAALYLGATKTGSFVLYGLYALGWVALFWLVAAYIRFAMHALAERYEISKKWRDTFLWISSLISLAVAIGLPASINKVVAAIVEAQTF